MPRKNKTDTYGLLEFESHTKKGKHLRIADNMMESAAWQELSVYAEHVYLRMKKKFNYRNADDISLTYKEGMLKMTKARYTAALDELIDHGFIKIMDGGWTVQKATIFSFSDQWRYYGTDKFKVAPRPKRIKQKEG